MSIRKLFFASMLLTLVSFSWYTTNQWAISSDYEVKFEGKGAEGTFKALQGTIIFDPNRLEESKMDVFVETNTIDTGNSLKDDHARGKKWFDAENYPRISFTSKSFSATKMGYAVVGTLSMKGKEKEIRIPFTFEDDTFVGAFEVSRKEFGIKGPFFSFTVGDSFGVKLNVPVDPAE